MDYRFLFSERLSPSEKVRRLGLENAHILKNMLIELNPDIDRKYGLYYQFKEDMDESGIAYSDQEFLKWLFERCEFYTTSRGVVLREKSGIFRKTVIAELYKHSELLKTGSSECDMAKAIDAAGKAIVDAKASHFEYQGYSAGGVRTRRNRMTKQKKQKKQRRKTLCRN